MKTVRFNLNGSDFLVLELLTVRPEDSLSPFSYFKEEINDAAGRRGLGRGGIRCPSTSKTVLGVVTRGVSRQTGIPRETSTDFRETNLDQFTVIFILL